MFWSKIWFFLVAILGGVAITIALALPQPAERSTRANEQRQLQQACLVAGVVLKDNARKRVNQVADIAASSQKLGRLLVASGRAEAVPADAHSQAKGALRDFKFEGNPPDLLYLLDSRGRIVAGSGKDTSYNAVLRGYDLVNEALGGYLRDDLWLRDGKLYAVAGSPLLTPAPFEWAGAVVTGRKLDNDFAAKLERSLGAQISFYVGEDAVANSASVAIHSDVVKQYPLVEKAAPLDCGAEPFTVKTAEATYDVLLSRLPGEAGQRRAFFAVYAARDLSTGFAGSFDALTKDDLSLDTFPWIKLALLFVFVVAVGIGLMWFEADRPIKALSADAVLIAQGERDRLDESAHRGKAGSIARSVNIALDKLKRESTAARKDLDDLLGPMPGEGDAGMAPAPAPTMPQPSPAAPPPSQFRFSDTQGGAPARAQSQPTLPDDSGIADLDLPPPPPNVGGPGAFAPPKPVTLPPGTPAPAEVSALDDDILGDSSGVPSLPTDDEKTVISDASARIATEDADTVYFREVFEDFLSLKRKCGEKTDSLTFERFAQKLRSNREALMSKHGCKSVRFQVYVKDGKAALKASPVR